MGLESVVPGRYQAQIVNWGVREVEKLDGAPEAWVSFEFEDQAGVSQTITWKGLFKTTAGEDNKKTKKTLETCGMKSDNFILLMDETDSTTLDKATPLDITIVDNVSADGSKTYKNVEWVNAVGDVGSGQNVKLTGDAAMSLAQKMARMGLGKMPSKGKAPVKNYAPGAQGSSKSTQAPALTGPPEGDSSDDVPF